MALALGLTHATYLRRVSTSEHAHWIALHNLKAKEREAERKKQAQMAKRGRGRRG